MRKVPAGPRRPQVRRVPAGPRRPGAGMRGPARNEAARAGVRGERGRRARGGAGHNSLPGREVMFSARQEEVMFSARREELVPRDRSGPPAPATSPLVGCRRWAHLWRRVLHSPRHRKTGCHSAQRTPPPRNGHLATALACSQIKPHTSEVPSELHSENGTRASGPAATCTTCPARAAPLRVYFWPPNYLRGGEGVAAAKN